MVHSIAPEEHVLQFPLSLTQDKAFDAIGFGLNAVDHLIVVPQYPAFDTKTRFLEHRQSPGGQTATAMVALKRLGLNTAYAGKFGSDVEGRFGLQSIEESGVNTDFVEVVEGARNQVAFIVIDSRSGERTIIWNRDERLAYSSEDAPIAFASRGRVLHLDAHDPHACVRMAQAARAGGVIVSADIDNIYEGQLELLPLIDILITSRDYPHRMFGIRDERASLVEMKARFGSSVVGMTMGARGALLYLEGQFIDSPAYQVPGGCRDTTGAGDAFHAGFIYGLLKGEDVETCLLLANATAALKCRELGARTALPTREELESFLTSAEMIKPV